MKKVLASILSLAIILSTVTSAFHASAASAPGNTELSRKAATEGMVLLENNGALPLDNGRNVAVFGMNQINYQKGGGGSGDTNVDYLVNLLEGLQNKEEEGKVSIYEPLAQAYQTAYNVGGRNEISISSDLLNDAVDFAESAIISIGRYSWEGADRSAGKGDYLLSDDEAALVDLVSQAGFDDVTVILNVGAVMDTAWIKANDNIDAVLMAWQAGMEGGNAMADILVGDVNPSGKTVDTFASSYEAYPSSDTFKESAAYVNYEEDIFVGYRYFETFDPDYETVNYEFGYGLSYTTFALENINVEAVGEDIQVSVDVKNTGERAGREVVQVYYSAEQGKLGKSAKELAAFAKTGELAKGETETLTMTFAISDMASYDDIGEVAKSAYVLEEGDYDIFVGNSIRNAGERGSQFTYTVTEDTITEQLTERMTPTQLSRRLLADGTYEDYEIVSPFDPYHILPAGEAATVEAEAYIDCAESVSFERYENSNFEEGYCIANLSGTGRWAEYDLTVEEAGTYAVTMRASNGHAAINNMIQVTVDGVVQPNIMINMPQTGDGSGSAQWYEFIMMDAFLVNLPEGNCRFRVITNGNCANIDYFLFEKVDDVDYYMPVAADGKTVIEAENFTLAHTQVRVEDFTEDGMDKQCVAYMNYENNWITYYLNVAEAGDYNFRMRIANGRADINDFTQIWVDNVQQDVYLNAQQTGDGDGAGQWYNFQETDWVTITLPEGKCEFKLLSNGLYPNIDTITFEKKVPTILQSVPQALAGLLFADEEIIMLADVYENPDLMSAFMAQLSDEDLIHMSGGQPNTGVANTGGMGNLMKYGIPNAMTADGPAGVRIGVTCTAWPCSTLLACTWDVDLLEEVGKAIGVECVNNGIDIWLGPGMNIHRDPLCGRNFEYYSEDPVLTGKLAAAITEGVQSMNVAVALKHFAANNKEENRSNSDSRMTERALREIYLKGFEIAIKEADAWTVMSSYNFINGTETAESYELLTNILREEWGFEGFVMTDWGNNSIHYKEAIAGNDVKMASGNPDNLRAAMAAGRLTRAELERNIERLLKVIMKLNVFQKVVNPVYTSIEEDMYFKAAQNIYASYGDIRSESCSDTDGGTNLGYCERDNWVTYNIDVQTGGTYDLSARIASNAGAGAFDVLVDNAVIASFVAGGATGGWQNWKTLDAQSVYLEAGQHQMKILITESGLNINWLHFVLTEPAELPELNTSILEYTIRYAEKQVENGALDNVIETVTRKFNEALTEAKSVYAGALATPPTVTQLQIDEAAENLMTIIHYLDFKGDKTDLLKLLETAQKYADNEAEYIPSSYIRFAAAFAEAVRVRDDGDALDDEIAEVFDELMNSILDLRLIPNKDKLAGLLKQAESINLSLFTADSGICLKNSINNAKGIINNVEAQEAEVIQAEKDLRENMRNLISINEDDVVYHTKSEKTGDNAVPTGINKNAGTAAGNPKTGDTLPVVWFVIAVAGFGALIVLRKKER